MANAKISRNIFFLIFATAPGLTAVVREQESSCSLGEVSCGDGFCIDANKACDGTPDCADHSDERGCEGAVDTLQSIWYPIMNRTRRQASTCRRSQWQCRNGVCISFDGKCDGIVNCRDGSDETHALCRTQKCQSNWFRCTYGACVDGSAPCNGLQECADNSDELLPRCRNETNERRMYFKCLNGETIQSSSECDGIADCSDGSDETVRACAGKICPGYLFQCAYGACVDNGADCNGVQECADGSDESDELCNRISAPTTSTTTTTRPVQSGPCVLPEIPAHGGYTVQGVANASPGEAFPTYSLTVTCNPGYGFGVKEGKGDGMQFCLNGQRYPLETPKCIPYCKLFPHKSVEYRCILNEQWGAEGTRECFEAEPSGTRVRPTCRRPNYYSPAGLLNDMECIDGSWNYNATCLPGLAQEGTNITILIKDKVEVHVGAFQYATQNGSAQSGPVQTDQLQSVPIQTDSSQSYPVITVQMGPIHPTKVQSRPIHTGYLDSIYFGVVQPVRPVEVQPSTQEPFNYDIDEGDWRQGLSSNSSTINIAFNNDTTKVVNDGAIYFRD